MIQRYLVAQQNMLALPRLPQQIRRPPTHHIHAMIDKVANRIRQRKLPRLPVHHRQEDHREAFLHLRMLVKLVQHNLRLGAALQLYHNPHAVAIALIADVGDIVDHLVVHQVRHALNQLRLVHLVWNLRHHDRGAPLRHLLNRRLRPHQKAPPPRLVRVRNSAPPVNKSARRKVWPLHVLQYLGQPRMRIVHHLNRRVDHFGQIVRRNVRRHPHRDPIRAIHNQVRNPRRQHHGLQRRLIIVRRKIHRLHVNIGQHLARDPHHAALRVSHRRRRIAVHRTKVALPVNHRITQAERLRQTHQSVVDRRVPVRVIHTHRLTHDLRALRVLLVMLQPHLVHRVKNAPMHRLETIAHIRQRAADNHRHRVVEVRTSHLVFNVDRHQVECAAGIVTAGPIAKGELGILIVCHIFCR